MRRVGRLRAQLCSVASTPSAMEVYQFPALSDNYGYLLHARSTGETAAVDTPELEPILEALKERNWNLTHIFNTHWHPDHCGANDGLRKAYPALQIFAPAAELDKISQVSKSGVDHPLKHGDVVHLGPFSANVIDVGYHTSGHIAYNFASESKAFVGDALFALGCGRMFEGTPQQAWDSMLRIRALPDDTMVYCAHEYTLSNAKYVASLGINDPKVDARIAEIVEQRKRGERTVPSLLSLEKATNPFLRADDASVREALQMPASASAVDVFAETRRRKDTFKAT